MRWRLPVAGVSPRGRDAAAVGGFDRVVCDFLVPAVNLPQTLPCPSILFTHNVEAEIWRRHAGNARKPLSRRSTWQQWRRMLRFEGRTLARFDRLCRVRGRRAAFRRLYGHERLAPIDGPNRRRYPLLHADARGLRRPKHLAFVFTGSMDWMPNEDAVLFFCREVLPRVREAEPDVTLTIVGRTPTAAVQRLAQEAGIEVTGTVGDVRAYLGQACATIVPLRVGGGTRLKIFEAMAAGKAVVSTTIGAEGLPTEIGRHLLIADGAEAFADAVVRLVRDPDCGGGSSAKRALVTRHYDWSVAADQLGTQPDRSAAARTASGRLCRAAAAARNTYEHCGFSVLVTSAASPRRARRGRTHRDRGRRQPGQGRHAQRRAEPDRRAGSAS